MFLRGKYVLCLWSISGEAPFSWDGCMVILLTCVLKNITNAEQMLTFMIMFQHVYAIKFQSLYELQTLHNQL